MALKARMYQRKHARSPRAVRKDYDFVELPMKVDVAPLVEELQRVALPWIESLWKWHRGTQFCVLRAGPAGQRPGDEMITGAGVDAPILDALPSFRAVLDGLFPAPAPLAWIGRSPPSSAIKMHVDNTQHWDEHHRLHVPLVTSPGARLCVLGRTVHMPAGTVWTFNNSRPHGAINTGPERLHLVLDLPGSPAIDALLASGRVLRGELDVEAVQQLSKDPLAGVHEEERRPEVLARMLQQ